MLTGRYAGEVLSKPVDPKSGSDGADSAGRTADRFRDGLGCLGGDFARSVKTLAASNKAWLDWEARVSARLLVTDQFHPFARGPIELMHPISRHDSCQIQICDWTVVRGKTPVKGCSPQLDGRFIG